MMEEKGGTRMKRAKGIVAILVMICLVMPMTTAIAGPAMPKPPKTVGSYYEAMEAGVINNPKAVATIVTDNIEGFAWFGDRHPPGLPVNTHVVANYDPGDFVHLRMDISAFCYDPNNYYEIEFYMGLYTEQQWLAWNNGAGMPMATKDQHTIYTWDPAQGDDTGIITSTTSFTVWNPGSHSTWWILWGYCRVWGPSHDMDGNEVFSVLACNFGTNYWLYIR
jgi:hypothetical protein